MKYKYLAFSLSGILIIAGILNITLRKGLKYGIDFAGGTLIRVMFKDSIPIEEVRKSLGNIGLGRSIIQQIGEKNTEYMIRTVQVLPDMKEKEELEAHEVIANKVIEALRSKLNTKGESEALHLGKKDLNNIYKDELAMMLEGPFAEKAREIAEKIIALRTREGMIRDYSKLKEEEIPKEAILFLKEKTYLGSLIVLSRETVGPQVGHDLRQKATQATIWALIGMLIYIALRFKLAFGVSAVLTLFHDVLVTLGIFSFTNREINLPVIAAILAIVGYSLNDTIVIFDRVRDNLKIMRRQELEKILDSSINQTLSRTILTSGTTLLTVIVLFIFGGEVINDFAFTIMIGIIVGTYSSIYQSCPILYFWNKIFKPKKGLRK